MTKAEAMQHWAELTPDMPILTKMIPITYGTRGSTYGACGIRIDGTPAFIDAVLSHLKELLDGENVATRLSLSRNVVDGTGIGKAMPNKLADAECCYIRLAERGGKR